MRDLPPDPWHWQSSHAALRQLLEPPVELVLPAHRAATDRVALERALS